MSRHDVLFVDKSGMRVCADDLLSSDSEIHTVGQLARETIGFEVSPSDLLSSSSDLIEMHIADIKSSPPHSPVKRFSLPTPTKPKSPVSSHLQRLSANKQPSKRLHSDLSPVKLFRLPKVPAVADKASQASDQTDSKLKPDPQQTPLQATRTSSNISWSSSPASHQTATLYSRLKYESHQASAQQDVNPFLSLADSQRPGPGEPPVKSESVLEELIISRHSIRREPSVKEEQNLQKSDVAPTKSEYFPKSGKARVWDQSPHTTQAARSELRRLNMQTRSMSTAADSKQPSAEQEKPGSKSLPNIPKLFLSVEQKRVLNIVVNQRKNVFFTGAAGTGKSVLLSRIIKDLQKKYHHGQIAVTASTGLAACNIGGITLHSFAGIQLGNEGVDQLIKKVKKNRKARGRWRDCKVLVIDEISMIDGELFDKLEAIARAIRKSTLPFGGIQVVITGDFFQLPPVPKKDQKMRFTFESDCWSSVIEHTILLRQIFRQKDSTFSTMLNEMRRGQMSNETIRAFQNLSRAPEVPPGITPAELYPMRYQVEQANSGRLHALNGPTMTFNATDFYAHDDARRMFNLDNLMAVRDLTIKCGSQVMMIKNVDETLVNGTLGKVIGFMSDSTFAFMGEDLSLLSSQDVTGILDGSSKEGVPEQLDDVFGIPEDIDMSSEEFVSWKRKRARVRLLAHESKGGDNTTRKWPLVRFYGRDNTSRDVLVQPEKWDCEDQDGEVVASRTQVPLILAWALSIHKAQGQTLEWVKVDLGKTFEKGQAYVAISRATNLGGLQVLRFSASKVMVHDRVVEFYDSLETVLTDDEIIREERKKPNGRISFARAPDPRDVNEVEDITHAMEDVLPWDSTNLGDSFYAPPKQPTSSRGI